MYEGYVNYKKLYRCTYKCPFVQNDMLTSIHKHRCFQTPILRAHVLSHPDNVSCTSTRKHGGRHGGP